MHWDTNNHPAMTDAELHALIQSADPNVHQVIADAALVLDLRGRQLSVLRNTYPGWDIDYQSDAFGRVWWTAELRRTLTLEMATAGVMRSVRQEDAIALASTLAWQSALLHNIALAEGRHTPRPPATPHDHRP
ncbi:hypothetical protein E1295_33195 [Nonomuraea mesophila]|uniref:Uncharacterized protein n=1 Tax=Nonomuraea mesophila TaxID=2530382 RepID=A0A4R5EVC6_9ACTN|nr:hypothetical protein [Nonomuraea mesophila]TDE38813.1 hypothetical protein E1295_33195 [Nonomuraea mesophila]